jgi:DNA-binding IclR family transcriptional regulator
LSISGPVDRITDSKVAKFVPLVVKAANDIAELINKAGGSFEYNY